MCEIIQSFDFETKEVRIIGEPSNPWFIAKDICNILELSNVSQAVSKLPEKWKGVYQNDTLGGKQNMITLSEAGVYKLIMRSDKIQAQKFQEWVCEELLPALRKKGEYRMNEEYQVQLKNLEDEKLKLEKENEQIKQQKKLLENKVLRNIPRVQYKDRNVIYIITSDFHLQTRTYMIGKAVNLTDRLSSYNRTMDHKCVFYLACNNASQMRLVEMMVLTILDKYREVKCRDRFILPEGEELSLFSDKIENVIDLLKDCGEEVELNISEEEKAELVKERNELYREDNKEYVLEQRKLYRDNNKEKIASQQKKFHEEHKDTKEYQEKRQEYRDNNKELIADTNKAYYEENKSVLNVKTKIWKENNKERLIESSKEYHEKNREEILKKNKIKVTCECGKIVHAKGMSRHRKTELHIRLIKEKQENEITELIDKDDESRVDDESDADDESTAVKNTDGVETTTEEVEVFSDTDDKLEEAVIVVRKKREKTKEKAFNC